MELREAMYGLKANRQRRTNVLTKGIFGRMKAWVPVTQDLEFTSNITMSLEAPFVALRIGIPNVHTAAITGVKACVANTNTNHSADYINSPNPPAGVGEWFDLTFNNGQPSVELPPAIAAERYSITWSDLIYLKSIPDVDGTGRPMIKIRIEHPKNVPITVPNLGFYNWRVKTNPRHLRATSQFVAGVTNKASFTATNIPTSPTSDQYAVFPLVQYVTEKEGHQLFIMGDSIQQGVGADVRDLGHWQRAAMELSTLQVPVDYVNAALHSQVAEVFAARLADLGAEIKPTVITYSPFSVNDVATGGIDDASLRKVYGNLGRIAQALERVNRNAQVVVPGGLPVNKQFKDISAGDQKRRDFNEWLKGLTGFVPVPGYVEALNGLESTGQTLIKAGLTTDNGHPNEAGHNALKEPCKALLATLL